MFLLVRLFACPVVRSSALMTDCSPSPVPGSWWCIFLPAGSGVRACELLCACAVSSHEKLPQLRALKPTNFGRTLSVYEAFKTWHEGVSASFTSSNVLLIVIGPLVIFRDFEGVKSYQYIIHTPYILTGSVWIHKRAFLKTPSRFYRGSVHPSRI